VFWEGSFPPPPPLDDTLVSTGSSVQIMLALRNFNYHEMICIWAQARQELHTQTGHPRVHLSSVKFICLQPVLSCIAIILNTVNGCNIIIVHHSVC
jgi:hypothetical protein